MHGKLLAFVAVIALVGVFSTPTRATESKQDDDELNERRSLLRRQPLYRQNQFSSVSSLPSYASAYHQQRPQTPLVSTAEEQASLVTGTYGLSGPPLKYVGQSAYGAASNAETPSVVGSPYQSPAIASSPYRAASSLASPYQSVEASPNYLGANAAGSYGQQQQQQQPYQSAAPQTPAPYQSASSNSYGLNKCDQCKSQCSLVSKPSCPYGDGWFQYRDSCYYFEKLRQLPWLQARGFCSLLTDTSGLHRGHLVIVNDIKEEQFLGTVANRLIQYGYPDRYWTDGVLVGTELADVVNSNTSSMNMSMSMTNASNWEWFTLYSLGDRSYYRPNITNASAAANADCVRVNVLSANNMPAAAMTNGTTTMMTAVPAAGSVTNPTGLFYSNQACLDIQTPLCEIQLDGALAR